MQLINTNAGIFRAPTIELRTTEMPKAIASLVDYRYESCLFSTNDSEVLARYNTLSDAVRGHNELALKHRLGTQVK